VLGQSTEHIVLRKLDGGYKVHGSYQPESQRMSSQIHDINRQEIANGEKCVISSREYFVVI